MDTISMFTAKGRHTKALNFSSLLSFLSSCYPLSLSLFSSPPVLHAPHLSSPPLLHPLHVICSGVFVYPLAEKEVVVGFEAAIAGRVVSVQIQSRGKLEDCCLDCCPTAAVDTQCTNGKDWCCCGNSSQDMQCTNGEGKMEKN